MGDRVEVKHSDEYVGGNDERLAEADELAAACDCRGDLTQHARRQPQRRARQRRADADAGGSCVRRACRRRSRSVTGNRRELRQAPRYAWLILAGAVLAVVIDAAGAASRATTRSPTCSRSGRARRRRSTTWPRCGARSRGRSCCGRSCWPGSRRPSRGASASALDDPLVGWALVVMFVVCRLLRARRLRPGEPVRRTGRPVGRLRRAGSEPVAAEPRARAVPPTDPVPRLRRVHGAVRVRDGGADHRPGRRGLAGRDHGAGRCSRGASSRSASCSAAGGATRCSAGAGVWAWDPVENASLLPWLTATAYIHSVLVQQRRGMLRVWNLSLLVATFALTILGTFLTRSGVIDSVHAFAAGEVDGYLLGFFGARRRGVAGAHRLARRPPAIAGRDRLAASRARARSSPTTCVFTVFAFIVLLGTVFPLIVEALAGSPHGGRGAVLRPALDADRHRPAVPDGGRAGAAVAQGLAGVAARSVVLAGVVRRRRACWSRSWSAPTAGRRWSPSGSPGSPPGRRCASSCSPPAGRAGGASSGAPTAA